MTGPQISGRNIWKWANKNRSDFIGLAGLVLGILGIGTGYWFYRASLSNPSLSFLDVGPHLRLINKSVVSDNDSPIRLIRKDGTPVLRSVYLAHLYLWNSGNVPLIHSAILRSLTIRAEGVEILDPRLGVVTRPDITALAITKNATNSITADFALLEPGDGCSLNLLYAADQPGHFEMTGAVLGVRSFSASDSESQSGVLLKTIAQIMKILLFLGLVVAIVVGLGALSEFGEKALRRLNHPILNWMAKMVQWSFVAAFAGLIAYGVFTGVRKTVLNDPSNFVPKTLMADTVSLPNRKGGE